MLAFISATSPVFEYEIPSFVIFDAASSSFKNLREYWEDFPSSRRYSRGSNGKFGAAATTDNDRRALVPRDAFGAENDVVDVDNVGAVHDRALENITTCVINASAA